MDSAKTGRLIAKRRMEMNMTQPQLSVLLHCTPQAISAWENGTNYPGPASQVMIEKVMGLNPVELLAGVKMYDENLKKEISYHMGKADEHVFTGGIATDENGNEFYMDMSDFTVVTKNEDGELSDRWIPYLEYHNAEPHVMTEHEKTVKAEIDAIPQEEYSPEKVYLNCGFAMLVIPREVLEAAGKPRFFEICQGKDKTWIGLKFGTDPNMFFDIPDEVYEGSGRQTRLHGQQICRGLKINGGEFAKELYKRVSLRVLFEKLVFTPLYVKEKNMLVLDLIEAKRARVFVDQNEFALPTWQFEEEMAEIEEEEAELMENEDE